mmetsp:Transcript_20757/g.70253  ORF Transcript_20757/g.70253 Transcript_20757/m.70253 type:complete len:331 (+) Transcript_20757:618-1610(+)
MRGLRPLEWATCDLLQAVLEDRMPDDEMAMQRIVLLDVSAAQLVKLGDYDQQYEALFSGPQCAGMRARLQSAELVIALVNDNDDAEVALGGGHWSAVAWRRSSWRDGVFLVEHYDPSGDVNINADAAGLFGAALAERLTELCELELERTEIWRMPAPMQHDPCVCGLTAVAYLQALVADHTAARGAGSVAAALSGPPASPPLLLDEIDAYTERLRESRKPVAGRLCSQRCEVVFDVFEDGDEVFDDGSGLGPRDPELEALLDACEVAATTSRLLCRKTTLAVAIALCLHDRPAFLSKLRELGVSHLRERQAIANAIGRGVRKGLLLSKQG